MFRNFYPRTFAFIFLVGFLSAPGVLRSETYLQYVERINSIKHRLKPGESLPKLLEERGYKDIYKHHGALNQTYWKNGIRPYDKNFKYLDIEISLPYDEEVAGQDGSTIVPALTETPKPILPNKISSPVEVVSETTRTSNEVKVQANAAKVIAEKEAASEVKSSEPLTENPKSSEQINRKISFIPGLDEWNVSVLYGMKYVSISQTGDLAKADFGVLFLNNLKLHSEFIFENWSAWFLIDSYKFKFESGASGDEARMYSLDLGLSYKWMLAAIQVNQFPIFRNNAGAVEMTRAGLMSLALGGKKDIELPTRKPTKLKLKGLFHFPVSSSTDSSDIEVSSVSGFGLRGQAELSREIFSRPLYSLHATWLAEMGYQKISQDVDWSGTKGSIDSSIIEASTALGLLFKF